MLPGRVPALRIADVDQRLCGNDTMKETRTDTALAFGLAVLLHLGLVAVLFFGLLWTRSAAPPAVGAISAELLDASQLSPAMRRTLERPQPVREETPPTPLPEPLPEPIPEPERQPKPQDFIPEPDEAQQAEVTELPTPTPAVQEKPQDAKQRQSQVDLTEMERQRQEQIENIRRRRAAAAREAELAEQRLQQLASARSREAAETVAQADSQASGNQGVDEGLQARYQAALSAAVRAKWIRPDSVPLGAKCMVRIRQLPGGTVMSAEVSEPCAYDEQGRRSIEAAVLKAQPLPYAGFEKVFSRDLEVEFTAQAR